MLPASVPKRGSDLAVDSAESLGSRVVEALRELARRLPADPDNPTLVNALIRARNVLDEYGRGLVAERTARRFFAVKLGKRTLLIAADDIEWVEGQGNYAALHVGVQSHLVRTTLHALESRLDPTRFARVHRSAIVRLDAIREIVSVGASGSRLVLASKSEVPLSRRYRHRVVRAMTRGRDGS